MGKFFDELFNKNKKSCNCPQCRGVPLEEDDIDVESMLVDVELENPEEIVQMYFNSIKEVAETEEEVYMMLMGLFFEGTEFGRKEGLLGDIQAKIVELNNMQYQEEE